MSKTSLDEIHTFQGSSVRFRIIKQKEQRYERNERQKHRTASRGKFSEYSAFIFQILIYFTPKGEWEAINFINMI